MTSKALRDSNDNDAGAILILAMIFLVAISLAILALSNWTENSLNDSLKFQNVSQRLYAAEGVTQLAVRASRYTYLNESTTASASGYICPGTSSPVQLNNYWIQDWCSTQTFPSGVGSTITREITITACLMPSGSSMLNPTPPNICQIGATNVTTLLTAVIDIDDVSATYPTNQCAIHDESACGANMTIKTWTAT